MWLALIARAVPLRCPAGERSGLLSTVLARDERVDMFHHHFTLKLYYEAFNVIGAVIARRLAPR